MLELWEGEACLARTPRGWYQSQNNRQGWRLRHQPHRPGISPGGGIPGVATLRAFVATYGIFLFPLTWYGDSC